MIDEKSIAGKVILSIGVNPSRDEFRIAFQDGTVKRYAVSGDCCSTSWIEHLEAPDVDGATLLAVDQDSYGVDATPEQYAQTPKNPVSGYEVGSLLVYHTKFRTTAGDIVLEYRNDSNGYYGGSLDELAN